MSDAVKDTGERKAYENHLNRWVLRALLVLLPVGTGVVAWYARSAADNAVTTERLKQVVEKSETVDKHTDEIGILKTDSAVLKTDVGYIKASVDKVNAKLDLINITGPDPPRRGSR